jgi:hypothetical protein
LWEATISVVICCMSVGPHGTARPPLDGFSLYFIFAQFLKIWREIQVTLKSSSSSTSSSSSIGTTARCGLWPIKQYPSFSFVQLS